MPGSGAITVMVSTFTVSSVLKDPQCRICSLDGNKSGENESSGQWLERAADTHLGALTVQAGRDRKAAN